MQTVVRGFHGDTAGLVGNQPMQLGEGQGRVKRLIEQIHSFEQRTRLSKRCALSKQPGNQLKLRDIVMILRGGLIDRVADEIQPRDAQTLFVDGVVIERIVVLNIRHADDSVVCAHFTHLSERKRVIARRDGHFISIGKLIIQIAPKVKIAGTKRCSCTHEKTSFIQCGFSRVSRLFFIYYIIPCKSLKYTK